MLWSIAQGRIYRHWGVFMADVGKTSGPAKETIMLWYIYIYEFEVQHGWLDYRSKNISNGWPFEPPLFGRELGSVQSFGKMISCPFQLFEANTHGLRFKHDSLLIYIDFHLCSSFANPFLDTHLPMSQRGPSKELPGSDVINWPNRALDFAGTWSGVGCCKNNHFFFWKEHHGILCGWFWASRG